MSLEQLFYRRNNIINDIFIDREFDSLMEEFYINDLEILEENAVTNFFGNIIETIKRFFSRLIETVKNLFRRNKSVNSDTMNEAKETINEAKKQKENNQRKEEARKKAEEARKAEEEAKRAKEEARKKAEEARKKAEEARKAEEEAKRKAEEEAKRKAEEEAKRKAEEAEEAKRAKEEARKKAEEARKKAEEAKKEAEDDILIKGYKIQGKKLTMLNYNEKSGKGYSIYLDITNLPKDFLEFKGIDLSENFIDKQNMNHNEFIKIFERDFIDAFSSIRVLSQKEKNKINKVEDLVKYLPMDRDTTEWTKTIELADFNISFYEGFLKYSDRFTVEDLKKQQKNVINKLNDYLEFCSSTSKDPESFKKNVEWLVLKSQIICTACSKQLFKMKKEIEEIIKAVVDIGNS